MRSVVNRPAVRRRSSFVVFMQLLLVASGLGVGGALAYAGHRFVMESPFFQLRNLDLESTPEPLRERVRQALQPALGANLLVADLAALRRRLERIPEIREATVRRVLPDSLEVFVTARAPWACVHAADGDFLLSREGIVLGRATGAGTGLVQLHLDATVAPALRASRRMPADAPGVAALADAMRIAEWLDGPGDGAFGPVRGLRLDARGVGLLPTRGIAMILLGTASDLGEKAQRLRALLASDPPPETAVVDLRYRDMVVVHDVAATPSEHEQE